MTFCILSIKCIHQLYGPNVILIEAFNARTFFLHSAQSNTYSELQRNGFCLPTRLGHTKLDLFCVAQIYGSATANTVKAHFSSTLVQNIATGLYNNILIKSTLLSFKVKYCCWSTIGANMEE